MKTLFFIIKFSKNIVLSQQFDRKKELITYYMYLFSNLTL